MSKDYYIHPLALVETGDIGAGTRIWPWSHVMAGATIGKNCNIGEHCYIEGGVCIGDDVVVKNGVAIWDGVTIEARAFLGPYCVLTNDPMPRSKLFKPTVATRVREGASVGANATLLCGIEIGRYALVGAGSVVTRSVPDFALVAGNPAKVRGYVCHCGSKLEFKDGAVTCSCGASYRLADGTVSELQVQGARQN